MADIPRKRCRQHVPATVAGTVTLADAMGQVIALSQWKNQQEGERSFRFDVTMHAAALLDRPVGESTSADVLTVIKPIWQTMPPAARNVKQRLSAIFKLAMSEGLRIGNPAGDVLAALPRNGHRTKHHAALHHSEAAAVPAIRAADTGPAPRLALEFLILTAARSVEVIGVRWEEIDLEGRTWTVPAARMKGGEEHRVPLSDAALAVLAAAEDLRDGSGFIFPAMKGGK